MNNTIKFLIKNINTGERADIFLSKNISHLTRSNIKKLIQSKNLSINGNIIVSPSTKLKKDDQLNFNIKEISKDNLLPKKMDLKIIHEDKDLLIINKPKGLVVHPGAGNYENTLANALAYRYSGNLSNLNGELRPGIVHRIDKNTSGLLVVAKNNFSHSLLGKQFSNHSIKRKYKCLIWGVIRPMHGRIESLISRSKKNRQMMTVSEIKGKKAITNYKTLKTFFSKDIPKISLIECELETGRTHQIRVHFKYKGTSILGDNKYGEKKIKFKKVNKNFLENLKKFDGQALHAQTLSFIHPSKNELVSFKSDLPEDFQKMVNLLNNIAG